MNIATAAAEAGGGGSKVVGSEFAYGFSDKVNPTVNRQKICKAWT